MGPPWPIPHCCGGGGLENEINSLVIGVSGRAESTGVWTINQYIIVNKYVLVHQMIQLLSVYYSVPVVCGDTSALKR